MLRVKQMLVGTRLGRYAEASRDLVSLGRALFADLESLGTIANDQLATHLITRLCRPQRTFVDVGAHIGSVLGAAVRLDASIKVIGIEAIPQKVNALRRRFPSVTFHECAAGEEDGQATFFIDMKHSGYSSLGRRPNAAGSRIQEIRVAVKRLDELVVATDVDLVKIDVEGAELGVLRGGTNLVSACRPTIMFESAPQVPNSLPYSKEDLWRWFVDRDYEILVPNRVAHEGPGLSQSSFLESHLYPRRTTNYFGVPVERRSEIRDRARALLDIHPNGG